MITCSKIGRMGRLGNQMFQMAALIGYNHKHRSGYSINWSYEDHFKSKFKRDKIKVRQIYKEKDFTYSPIPKSSGIDIEGYFQSEKYFEGSDIKKHFQHNEEIGKYINEKYGELLTKEVCSIHVRRGDYLSLPDYHNNLPVDYYNKAIDCFDQENTTFLVFSDDIKWCQENIKALNIEYVTEERKAIYDLFIMSKCKHNIIANSSFSWWASYLNKNPDKKVIAPTKDKWFGKLMNKSVDDLYLDNWILV